MNKEFFSRRGDRDKLTMMRVSSKHQSTERSHGSGSNMMLYEYVCRRDLLEMVDPPGIRVFGNHLVVHLRRKESLMRGVPKKLKSGAIDDVELFLLKVI